jgi:hypothetical protein
VVVDKHRIVWYENPTWKVRTILQGKTKPDNVCAAAVDIDGGGDLELVVGAGWNAGTKVPGTLQWLKRGKTLDDEWTLHPIPCDEPTVHRVKVADLDGDGKQSVVVAPLHGRDCTAKGNWTDGRPVRIVSYPIPSNPTDPAGWKTAVLSDSLFVTHNLTAVRTRSGSEFVAVSYDGVHQVRRSGPGWATTKIGAGNQAAPKGSRGASEVARSATGNWLATIEPWHGNEVVVYRPPHVSVPAGTLWDRTMIDDHLRWGHAIRFADLDGDGVDELIAGVRDDPNPKAGDQFTERRGVRLYRCTDGEGAKWDRFLLEDGGVAVEDLAVQDLNGDGKPDIVAVGRQTGNCRIYWNQGK